MTKDTAHGEAGGQRLWFPGLFGTGRESGLAGSSSAIRRLDIGLPKRMLNTDDAPGFRPEDLPLHPEQMAALAGEFQLLASESARGSGALNEAVLSLEREREEARVREERVALARFGQFRSFGQDGQEIPGSVAKDDQALERARLRAQRTLLLLWLEERQARELDELMGRVEKGFSLLGEAFGADGKNLPGQTGLLENERTPLARWKVMLKAAVVLCPQDAVYVLETPVLTDADGRRSPALSSSGKIPDDLLELFGRARACPLAESVASEVALPARALEIGCDELFPDLVCADGKGAILPEQGPLRLVFLEGRE